MAGSCSTTTTSTRVSCSSSVELGGSPSSTPRPQPCTAGAPRCRSRRTTSRRSTRTPGRSCCSISTSVGSLPTWPAQLVGLRYFNVYGPREQHKGSMASMVHQIDRALEAGHDAVLFGPSHGRPAGGHRRDFVHVDDVVDVICWFLDHPDRSGAVQLWHRAQSHVRGAGRCGDRRAWRRPHRPPGVPGLPGDDVSALDRGRSGRVAGRRVRGRVRDLEAGVAATVTPSPRRIAS